MELKNIIQNKLFVTLTVLLVLFGVIIFISQKNRMEVPPQPKIPLVQVKSLDAKSAKKDLIIIESNKLYDLGDNQPVITAVIQDPEALKKTYPSLHLAYKGDVLITSKEKTVIFDPRTKSIRDLSGQSLYKELSEQK